MRSFSGDNLLIWRSLWQKYLFGSTTATTPTDILKDVAPLEGEPIVKSSADKFFKTDLEKILNDRESRRW